MPKKGLSLLQVRRTPSDAIEAERDTASRLDASQLTCFDTGSQLARIGTQRRVIGHDTGGLSHRSQSEIVTEDASS